jgi:hypothetical protein
MPLFSILIENSENRNNCANNTLWQSGNKNRPKSGSKGQKSEFGLPHENSHKWQPFVGQVANLAGVQMRNTERCAHIATGAGNGFFPTAYRGWVRANR